MEKAVFDVLRQYPPEPDWENDEQKSVDEQKSIDEQKNVDTSRKILPWEIIFMGGDDISLVASADIVLEVGIKIMEAVEEATKETMERNTGSMPEKMRRPHLSMAGGVAVGPPHFPVQSLNKLAKDLEKAAKKKAYELRKEDPDSDPSTIDFHRVTASGNTDLDHVRTSALKPSRPSVHETVEMTHRPYEINECKEILDTARLWRSKKLPGSKVHLLYDALFESPATAMYTWAKVVGRARKNDAEQWRKLETVMNELMPHHEFLMPWYVDMTRVKEGRDRYRNTFLLDVIEVWSMLPKNTQ